MGYLTPTLELCVQFTFSLIRSDFTRFLAFKVKDKWYERTQT